MPYEEYRQLIELGDLYDYTESYTFAGTVNNVGRREYPGEADEIWKEIWFTPVECQG